MEQQKPNWLSRILLYLYAVGVIGGLLYGSYYLVLRTIKFFV